MLHNSDMKTSTSQTSPPSRRSGGSGSSGGGVQIPKVSRVAVDLQTGGGVRVLHVAVPATLSYSKCNAPLCVLASSLCFLVTQIIVLRRTFNLSSLLTFFPFDKDAGLFGVNCGTRDSGGGGGGSGGRGRGRGRGSGSGSGSGGGHLVKVQPIARHS